MSLPLAAVWLMASAPMHGFTHGLPTDPHFFPIAVWLQDPSNADRYKKAGLNLYSGLWQGPTEEQLASLKAHGMPVLCSQNAVGLAHINDPTIVGWLQDDEPDNAQSLSNGQGYGPCVPPSNVVAEYRKLHMADPTRPVLLNLGQGVANDGWIGRGNGAQLSDYKTYVQGGDIISFDIYPVAGLPGLHPEDSLWLVPKGLDRLSSWMNGAGTRWNCIECTRIDGGHKPTPSQVRSEVWMSLIHGSRGLTYFVHQFKPEFDEHALLDDPEMLAEVTAINQQIHELAPALNSPNVPNGAVVTSQDAVTPIDAVEKRVGRTIYVFAVGMRNNATSGRFVVKNLPPVSVGEVIGEGRTVAVRKSAFADKFGPYQPHLYRFKLP